MPPDDVVVAPPDVLDGVVDVPMDSEGGTTMPAGPMSDLTSTVMEQSFTNQHQGAQHAFRRLMDGQDNVAEQTRLQFITSQSLFAAKAAGNLNMDPLSKAILDGRSARDQPNFKPV